MTEAGDNVRLPRAGPGRDLRAVFGIAWRAAPAQLAGVLALTVMVALLPTATVVLLGLAVGAIPAVVHAHGWGSPAGHHLLLLLVGYAGAQLVIAGITTGPLAVLTISLNGRYQLLARTTVARATLSPSGTAHLDAESTADQMSALFVDHLNVSLWNESPSITIQMLRSRLAALSLIAVLFGFAWWAPLLLVGCVLAVFRLLRESIRALAAPIFGSAATDLRRASYLRDLGLRPAVAKEVRVFDLGNWIGQQFGAAWLGRMRDVWLERRHTQHRALIVIGVQLVANGVLVWAICHAAIAHQISLAGLAVYLQATIFSQQEAFDTMGVQLEAARAEDLSARALRVAAAMPEPRRGGVGASGMPRHSIALDDVTFRYPGQQLAVLEHCSLAILAGRSTAIVGLNGAGKTTLLKLLAGLHMPDSGAVRVDGVALDDLDLARWRRQLAIIFQDFTRFPLSLRENVGFGAVELLDDDDVLGSALHDAGGDDLLAGDRLRWDTPLDPGIAGGTELSGGQWQRIALARALTAVRGGAQVLVLDEPTASLDVRAEAELFDRFLDLTRGLTTILVSHRFSTVRHADRILVLDRGRLAESGTHAELVAAGGHYAGMFHTQASRFIPSQAGDG